MGSLSRCNANTSPWRTEPAHTNFESRAQRFIKELAIRGVLMTMFDGRTNLANDVVKEVRRYFPDKVFDTVIPRSIRLAEAPSYGQPISYYAPSSPGALAYASLAREVLEQDGVRIPMPQEA